MKSNLHVLLNALLCISLATPGSGAQAEMLKPDSAASTERDRVIAALQRPEIRARLAAQGVDAREAEARVASLTDDEAALLGSRFDELPAGGNSGLAGLLGVAVVAYFVIKLLPFIVIGGGALAAIKASNRNS